jgi:hypothetical protein
MWTILSDVINPKAIVPFGGGRLLVAGEQNAMSADEGKSWHVLDLPAARGATRSHIISEQGAFTSDDQWKSFRQTFKKPLERACEHEAITWASSGSALHCFADGKWTTLSTKSRKRIGAITYGHGALLLSVGKQTIYRSTDFGDNWTQHTVHLKTNEWLTEIWVLDAGFIGVTNAIPFSFWSSEDGAKWTKVATPVPSHWSGVAAGDQLYLAGAGTMTVIEHMGHKAEPAQCPGEVRVVAWGPDDQNDDRLWAASRTTLWIAR